MVIVTDKNRLNHLESRAKINKSLKNHFFYGGREWPYKHVHPRIIAEAFLSDPKTGDLKDYKIHCFNGKPVFLQVIGNRNLKNHTGNQMFYTFEWKNAGWTFGDYPPYEQDIPRPDNLEELYEIARKLSSNLKYVRVDLYDINNKIYFGELTLLPNSGFYAYHNGFTRKTDEMLGRYLKL